MLRQPAARQEEGVLAGLLLRSPHRMSQVAQPASLSAFDRFASGASSVVSRAPFFSGCVLIVVIWVPTLFLMAVNTSQLIINTVTTIITFLLVALLQNTQTRSDEALQQKLNAIADGLADLMSAHESGDRGRLERDERELRAAVGLEDRESA
jgi:Flp pilus assembly protein TadB